VVLGDGEVLHHGGRVHGDLDVGGLAAVGGEVEVLERRWGVAGCPPAGETGGAVETDKRRGRRALEAAAAGGGEQATGGGAGLDVAAAD
jgi:hypothetical protein